VLSVKLKQRPSQLESKLGTLNEAADYSCISSRQEVRRVAVPPAPIGTCEVAVVPVDSLVNSTTTPLGSRTYTGRVASALPSLEPTTALVEVETAPPVL